MSQGIAEVNNINIWWEDFGDSSNPTVLLIMGANANAMQWRLEFINPIVAAGFHVIRFDNRDAGNGGSIDGIIHFCEEILKVVNDETVVVPGHGPISTTEDLQTYIDMLIVVRDRIQAQILEGKSLQEIIESDPTKEWRDKFGDGPFIVGVIDRAYAGMTKSMEHNMKGEYLDGLVCIYRELIGSRYPFDEQKFREGAKAIMDHGHNPFPGHGAAVSSSPHRKDRLKEINLPTLVIHGTEDAILPFDHGQALADGIPNAKLMVLEGVGHEIPEQMTEEITSRMIEHFNSI